MTFLLFLMVFIGIPAIGSLVFMYKARNGEWELNTNSWHVKFLSWLWTTPGDDYKVTIPKVFTNACTYYWFVVISIYLVIPIFLVARYITYIIESDSSVSKKEDNKPRNKLLLFFKQYTEVILKWIYISLLVICVGGMFFVMILKHGILFTTFFLSVCLVGAAFVLGSIYLGLYFQDVKPEAWDKITNFFSIIGGIIIYIPSKLWKGFTWLVSKIFNFRTDLCPPIKWN
jgi:hypothetical protein